MQPDIYAARLERKPWRKNRVVCGSLTEKGDSEMKKIMFSKKHGMTDAVLRGRKTMTRRLCDAKKKYDKYKIWQPAEQMPYGLYGFNEDEGWAYIKPRYFTGEIVAIAQPYKHVFGDNYRETAGWNNKLFVKPELMPHKIRIVNWKVERLQDISNEDCMKEGILTDDISMYRRIFASLIDKINGKGTWERNPYVFVYEFELIK